MPNLLSDATSPYLQQHAHQQVDWRPWGAAAAALLFGFSSALAQRLPAYSESAAVLFQALPYVLTLIAVAGVIGRSIPPAAVGKPYEKQ